MNKDEILEVREYHFKKTKRLCQGYIWKELDYKTDVTDGRLIEIGTLIRKLNDERERINEINKMLFDYDNRKWLNDKWRITRKVVKCIW